MYDLSVSHSVEPAALQSAIATTAVPAALFSGFKPQPSPTTPTVQMRTYTTPHTTNAPHTQSGYCTHSRAADAHIPRRRRCTTSPYYGYTYYG